MKTAMKQTLAEVSGVAIERKGNSSVVTGHDKRLASLQFDYDADTTVEEWWSSVAVGMKEIN